MALKDYPNVAALTCDALVTGFLPSQPIRTIYNKSFYIPSAGDVKDLVQRAIGRTENKNKRVLESIDLAIRSRHDADSYLWSYYFSTCQNPLLEHEWVYRLGELYRYREGERKKAMERASKFWNSKEVECFRQIHHIMRKETKKLFERKKSL